MKCYPVEAKLGCEAVLGGGSDMSGCTIGWFYWGKKKFQQMQLPLECSLLNCRSDDL